MKAKQQLIVGIKGLILNSEESEVLQHPAIHGVILFSRNYHNVSQLQTLTASIHNLRPLDPVKIYVDQEGGRVQRFKEGFTALPALADLNVNDAFAWAELMATELKFCGVDQSFAPVVDLDQGSQVIGNRAFAADYQQVIACSAEYIAGMEKAGMMGTLKHFPGHGSVLPDTHEQVACDNRSLSLLEASDLKPFIHFAKSSVGIMVCHVVYPQIDPDPASLSHFWISQYLRGKLGFTGPIFTDDLGMKAVSEQAKARDLVRQAFDAGADYALLCNDWSAVVDTLRVLG